RNAHAAAWPRLDASGMRLAHMVPGGAPPFDLRIRFVGVWDTVGALGIPGNLSFLSRKKYEFHDTALSRAVQYARHAVAIDERRNSFKPTLWSNLAEINRASLAAGHAPRVRQAWFPGDHGCVGGGGVSRALSNCALLWVLEGAEEAGLKLSREPGSVVSACLADVDPIHGPLQARPGFNLTAALGAWRGGLDTFEDLHETAELRWMGNHKYRPGPLKQFRARFKELVNELQQTTPARGRRTVE
ncbi:MAG: DUF2235 domain-containing protein, partial [Hyphomonadaceae bacterium]